MIKNQLDQRIAENIRSFIATERVLENEPMSAHTSFRIGGPADVFVIVNTQDELSKLLQYINDNKVNYMFIGNGSNFLVSDNGYRGVMITLGGEFDSISVSGDRIKVGAAKLLSSTSSFATENGLAGIEFASGIPGSIGGAIYMNAGAYGGEMKDVTETVDLLSQDGKRIFSLSGEEIGFEYRNSKIQSTRDIVCAVVLKLQPDDKLEIAERVKALSQKRNSKQPVTFPSAGSTFKRPASGYAAALIEEAGLKGLTVGGAQVSEKHSGFVINIGEATCNDVLELMRQVRERVLQNSGILLEPEVRIIGEEL